MANSCVASGICTGGGNSSGKRIRRARTRRFKVTLKASKRGTRRGKRDVLFFNIFFVFFRQVS